MPLLHSNSLSETVNAIGDAVMFGEKVTAADRREVASWIASRLGGPRAYAGTFELTPSELSGGIRIFTGERATNASARHIAGQEACRALRLLQPDSAKAQSALKQAAGNLAQRVGPSAPKDRKPNDGQQHWLWPYRGGTYCCGPCSAAFWRHLTAGGYDDPERRLDRAMKCLNVCRKGDSQWRVFPFWYTLSALIEMDTKQAIAEMRYAAAKCEKPANAPPSENPFTRRRSEIARRLLAKV